MEHVLVDVFPDMAEDLAGLFVVGVHDEPVELRHRRPATECLRVLVVFRFEQDTVADHSLRYVKGVEVRRRFDMHMRAAHASVLTRNRGAKVARKCDANLYSIGGIDVVDGDAVGVDLRPA